MFLVQSGLKNKKKVFVNKRGIPLKSSLIRIEKIKLFNGSVRKIYHYDVFVEVDKRVMIEQDVQKIEVEISKKSLNVVNNRETMLEGVDTKNPRIVNMIANNAQKLRMHTTINKRNQDEITKIGEVSSDEVFDSKTISKIKKFNLPDSKIFPKTKKRYVLRKSKKGFKNLNKKFLGRRSSNFIKMHRNKSQNNKNFTDPSKTFKKKYNKMLKSGLDPTKMIFGKVENNKRQSSFNFLKGRRGRLKKVSNYARRNVLNGTLSNKIENIEPNANLVNENLELVLENERTRNATLKQRIKISEKHFLKLKKANLFLLFIAKDKKGVSIDVSEGFINHFEEKKRLNFPNFDFEIEANRNFRKKVTLTIRNNDKRERKFNVYAIKGSGYLNYKDQKFTSVGSFKVKAGRQLTLFRKSNEFPTNRSVYFRVNLVHDGIEYSNSKFASVTVPSKPSETFNGGVTAKSDAEKIIITAVNVPEGTRRVQIIKRNLSKYQKDFVPIKKKSVTTGLLEIDQGLLIDQEEELSLTFDDVDVEKNNVYEYKINVFDETGNKQVSAHSYTERYVEKKNLLNVGLTINVVNQLATRTFYNLTGTVKKIQTDADKVFNDLFGNFYDLFKEDLSQIRDLNTLSYNLLIEVYNKESGELIIIDDMSVDRENTFEKRISVDNSVDHFIKITPRAQPPAEIIAKINNLLPFYSKKQRFLPISAFNTAAIKKRIKNANTRTVSYVGSKYSDRSNRLKSRINNRNAELQSKNYDLYFDGETGDNLYVDLKADSEEQKSRINSTPRIAQSLIKLIPKNNLKKVNDQHLELGEERFLASFTVLGVDKNIDFFTMFYKENGNTVTTGLACAPSGIFSSNRVNYIFTIDNAYGKIDFYAQPVSKDGSIMNALSIGSILKDDRGVQ